MKKGYMLICHNLTEKRKNGILGKKKKSFGFEGRRLLFGRGKGGGVFFG